MNLFPKVDLKLVARYVARTYRNPMVVRAMLTHNYLARDDNANFRHLLLLAKARRRTGRSMVLEQAGRDPAIGKMKPARPASEILSAVLKQLTVK